MLRTFHSYSAITRTLAEQKAAHEALTKRKEFLSGVILALCSLCVYVYF